MSGNDKQYYIYLRSTKERVPCTKDEFDNYYRDINAFRRTQQRHGRCVCPQRKWLSCDMDCATCPFRRGGDQVSLDYTTEDEDGEETCWSNNLEDPSPLIEDIVVEGQAIGELFDRLRDLMPQALEIGQLRQQGLTERQIEERIGIGRKTYAYRLKKAKEILEKEFPEIFL